jgi:zinc transporter ZupT
VQAKRDTESSNFSNFWMPAFAGMTVFMALSAIATQSLRRYDNYWTFYEFVTFDVVE